MLIQFDLMMLIWTYQNWKQQTIITKINILSHHQINWFNFELNWTCGRLQKKYNMQGMVEEAGIKTLHKRKLF